MRVLHVLFVTITILLIWSCERKSEEARLNLDGAIYQGKIIEKNNRFYVDDTIPYSGPVYTPHNVMYKQPGRSWTNIHTYKEAFELVDGYRHGKYRGYHMPRPKTQGGRPIEGLDSVSGEFVHGNKTGHWVYYNFDGKTPWRDGYYKSGKKDSLWTTYGDSSITEQLYFELDEVKIFYLYNFEGSQLGDYSAFDFGTYFIEKHLANNTGKWFYKYEFDTAQSLSTVKTISENELSINLLGKAKTVAGTEFSLDVNMEVEQQLDRIRIEWKDGSEISEMK